MSTSACLGAGLALLLPDQAHLQRETAVSPASPLLTQTRAGPIDLLRCSSPSLLLLCGVLLFTSADDKSLSFYNVVAGGTIHMVLQLRGGGGL